MKSRVFTIIALFGLLVLISMNQAEANPWKTGPCVSEYDGVSPSVCPYSDETIQSFVSVCTAKLGDKIHIGRLRNEAWDTNDLLAKGTDLCECIIFRIRKDYTEEFFLEWILPEIGKAAQVSDIMVPHTNKCAVELEIYKPGYPTFTND